MESRVSFGAAISLAVAAARCVRAASPENLFLTAAPASVEMELPYASARSHIVGSPSPLVAIKEVAASAMPIPLSPA